MARSRLTPDQRRDQILDLGMAAFSVLPFEQVAMEDIAAQAGISRALIYHYFPSKAHLVDAMVAMAQQLPPSPDRHARLTSGLQAITRSQLQQHGLADPDAGLRSLTLDIELNAQGLGVWLDRAAR